MPRLMVDESEQDGHAETLMDYILSWTLRCAKEECANIRPTLQKNCKKVLCKLIGVEDPESVKIIEVKTWKQEYRIDLWVELELLNHGKSEHHAILIENKYYTGLHPAKDIDGEYRNQLEVYKKKFDAYYDRMQAEWQRHYALVTCIERYEPEKFEKYLEAEDYGFKIHTFDELSDSLEETGSDIFNEFWLRW